MLRVCLIAILLLSVGGLERGNASDAKVETIATSKYIGSVDGIIAISTDGQVTITATVPESVVHHLKIGEDVEISFPKILEEHDGYMVAQEGAGHIIKISGNIVIVKLTSLNPEAETGMDVDLSFTSLNPRARKRA